jgi:hypothetical protein
MDLILGKLPFVECFFLHSTKYICHVIDPTFSSTHLLSVLLPTDLAAHSSPSNLSLRSSRCHPLPSLSCWRHPLPPISSRRCESLLEARRPVALEPLRGTAVGNARASWGHGGRRGSATCGGVRASRGIATREHGGRRMVMAWCWWWWQRCGGGVRWWRQGAATECYFLYFFWCIRRMPYYSTWQTARSHLTAPSTAIICPLCFAECPAWHSTNICRVPDEEHLAKHTSLSNWMLSGQCQVFTRQIWAFP